MRLVPARAGDLPQIAALVNRAYRGAGAFRGWRTEAGYIEGQRTDPDMLAADLAANSRARLLMHPDEAGAPIACVWLEPDTAGRWSLGMLTVRPDMQASGLGRQLLAAAEEEAQTSGATSVRMTVVNIRDTLIAWYERRGYRLTGETKPFPYGDTRFGAPLRDDLCFVVLEKVL